MKDSVSFWCFVFLRCLIYKVQTRPLPCTGRSFIIPPSSLLVKPFFNFFKISFEPVSSFHPSARSRELCYLTTASPVCQELFCLPTNLFLLAPRLCRPSFERSVILANLSPFVNTFFAFFDFFRRLHFSSTSHTFPLRKPAGCVTLLYK